MVNWEEAFSIVLAVILRKSMHRFQEVSNIAFEFLSLFVSAIQFSGLVYRMPAVPSAREKKMSSLQSWVAEHKLTSIGAVWASALGTSLAFTRKRSPMIKTSLRLIHARMHAQALTLAVLSGAALMHYYDAKDEIATDDGENVTPPHGHAAFA